MGVAQLVERRVVVADAAGSSPVTHPTGAGKTLRYSPLSCAGERRSRYYSPVKPSGQPLIDQFFLHPPAATPSTSSSDRSEGRSSFSAAFSGLSGFTSDATANSLHRSLYYPGSA